MKGPEESPRMTQKVYTVFGYKSAPILDEHPHRDEGVLIFFESATTRPHEAADKAISLCCDRISIFLTGGEKHYEQVVKLIEAEVAARRSEWGSRKPLVPEGESAIYTVLGYADSRDLPAAKSTHRRVFANEMSTTPGKDVERAIELGATDVGLEVRQWKTGTRWPRSHILTKEELSGGRPPPDIEV